MENGSRQHIQEALEVFRQGDKLGGGFIVLLGEALESGELQDCTTEDERAAIAQAVAVAYEDAGGETGPDGQGRLPLVVDAKRQFQVVYRWILFSGLPSVLKNSEWAVFRALMEFDHQTARMDKRRHGQQGLIFAVPQEDIVAVTGFGERVVRTATYALHQETRLLPHYKRGTGGNARWTHWGHYQIGTKAIRDLFVYVAPLLRPHHGGLWGYSEEQLREVGDLQIYGDIDGRGRAADGAVVVTPGEIAVSNGGGAQPPAIELDRVKELIARVD